MNYKKVLFVLSTFLCTSSIFSQCTFTSTNGYQVHISIAPINLVVTPTGGDCVYQAVMQYNIQFTGSNIPSGLSTLQGNVGCYGIQRFYNLPNSGGSGTVNSSNFNGPFINGNCAGYNANGCTFATIIIQGPGIPYQEVQCSFSTFPNPLPLELISFSGVQNDNATQLEWLTASERNNDYFTLEHSTDGINFSIFDRVIGAGTTNVEQKYLYANAPLSAGLNYYRLSQTDYDGTKTILKIVSVKNESNASFILYPNPSTSKKINVSVNTNSKLPITYKIFSMYGQLIATEKLSSVDAVNQIDLPQNGTQYIIELEQGNTLIGREKVVIL